MSGPPPRSEPRRLRVPPADGSALVEPGWDDLDRLVEANRQRRKTYQYDFHGRSLAELADEARSGLLDEARHWTVAYRDTRPALEGRSGGVFLTGHQPELVHPGVWFKNFALDHLARRHGAVAVNLLVDSDTVKNLSVPVPGGTLDRPELALLAMDLPDPVVPYEERRIEDPGLFARFGDGAMARIGSLVPDSMVAEFWSLVVAASRRSDRLGACLAQARHELEGRWGLATLEVPASRVCGLAPFAWFAAHVLAELPRFHGAYNEAVRGHRQAERIRDAAHPVPDLRTDGSWLESPFWIWTERDPRRRPLWARRAGGAIELSDGKQWRTRLPSGRQAEAAVAGLRELAGSGVKIRGRTLLTTLFARLFLGDGFLHGIGGSKYDRVTDAIIRRFFGLVPPEFVTVSATMRLPARDRSSYAGPSPGEIRQRLRQLEFHPERFLDHPTTEAAQLAAEKARWIAAPKTPASAAARHRRLRQVNAALRPWTAAERERLLALSEEAQRAAEAEAVLAWREYAACLFPAASLRQTLLGLLPP